MKMKDVFSLPISYAGEQFRDDGSRYHEITGNCLYSTVIDDSGLSGDKETAKAICEAVNNHDRLTEENEKLKAVLLYAKNECTYSEPSLSVLQRMIDETLSELTNKGE